MSVTLAERVATTVEGNGQHQRSSYQTNDFLKI